MIYQCSIELEFLCQIIQFKYEDVEGRLIDLEFLFQIEKNKIQEFEEQVSLLEKKCGEIEVDFKGYLGQVVEFQFMLEVF